MTKDSTRNANIVDMDELQETFKDDPDVQREAAQAHIGLSAAKFITTHADLMAQAVTPLEFILHPILPRAGYVLLHAAPGVGKTYFALNLAYAIAQGGRFLRYAAPAPKKVLYIDAELGEQAIRRRVDQIHLKQGRLHFENLDYLFYDKFPNGHLPQIDTEQGRRFYSDYLIKGGYEGMFADNLINLTTSDLNKPNEWYPIQQWIRALRKRGLFFFLLHHAGSDVTKQLGTTARETIAHTVISLQRPDKEIKNRIKVEYQKYRDMKEEEAQDFMAVNNYDGSFTYEDIQISFDDLVLDYWKRGLKEMQIFRALKDDMVNCYPKKVYRTIDRLRRSGRI